MGQPEPRIEVHAKLLPRLMSTFLGVRKKHRWTMPKGHRVEIEFKEPVKGIPPVVEVGADSWVAASPKGIPCNQDFHSVDLRQQTDGSRGMSWRVVDMKSIP